MSTNLTNYFITFNSKVNVGGDKLISGIINVISGKIVPANSPK